MLPWIDTDLSSLGMLGSSSNALDSAEKVYAFRPSIPPTPEEASDMILEKLEQAGRVPSKDKFRRMACNVSRAPVPCLTCLAMLAALCAYPPWQGSSSNEAPCDCLPRCLEGLLGAVLEAGPKA